jgi:TonB family protein
MIRFSQFGWRRWLPAAVALLCVPAVAAARPRQKSRLEERSRVAEEKTGTFTTRDGLRLRLVADLGNVRILTGSPSGQVSYRARIETDSPEPDAQELLKKYLLTARTTPAGVELIGQSAPMEAGRRKGRGFHRGLWVSFEVNVPRNYSLDVLTNAGNIETQDLDGRAVLATQGGNISAGKLGGPEAAGARLETQGGHITVEDVNGELRASTAGGHIRAANVRGDAVLRSGGGHIRAGSISGTAQLETGGGNIAVERAGADVLATTGGGQIDCGEAAGSIKARTGGGGIRILRVTGPTQLETGGGSIFLTQVRGPVRASTGAGTITAWFGGGGKLVKLAGASQLESGAGDIIVYIPHELAITIEAIVETGGEHRIEADPSLPLKFISPGWGASGRAVRAECAVNGGGEVLRLKTAVGNIRLKFSNPDVQNLMKQQMEQLEQRFKVQHRQHERLQEQMEKTEEKHLRIEEREATRWEEWSRKLEKFWSGGIHVDPDTQQRRLVQSVLPVYPDVAKQAGIEGSVRVKAYIGKDGTVQSLKVVSGPPALVDAAAEAVRQWRYQPTLVDGKPVNVITTVTVDFRLK